jgi:hypothetical protein
MKIIFWFSSLVKRFREGISERAKEEDIDF